MRYIPDPAKLLKTILKRKIKQKRGKKVEGKEGEKLVTMVIRILKYKKEMIKNIAKNQGRYEVDIIRSGIDKKLNLDLYQDKMDLYNFYNIGDIYREEFRNE